MARPLSRLLASSRSFTTTSSVMAAASSGPSGPSTAMSVAKKAFANRNFETHEELYKFSIEKVSECQPALKISRIGQS